jgi:hypothetical protein
MNRRGAAIGVDRIGGTLIDRSRGYSAGYQINNAKRPSTPSFLADQRWLASGTAVAKALDYTAVLHPVVRRVDHRYRCGNLGRRHDSPPAFDVRAAGRRDMSAANRRVEWGISRYAWAERFI